MGGGHKQDFPRSFDGFRHVSAFFRHFWRVWDSGPRLGSWFMVHESWFMVYGSWFMVHGSWFMVYGSWFMVGLPRSLSSQILPPPGVRGSGFGVFGVWGSGIRGSGFGDSGFGFRGSGFGVRVSGFGFRVSGFGVRVSDVKPSLVLTGAWPSSRPRRVSTISLPTEGPSWGYSGFVVGAIGSFLEPFRGYESPKVDKSSIH